MLGSSTIANAQLISVFDQWDKDRNGKLSREELPANLRKNFDRVDINKDGWISRQEDANIRSQQVQNRRVVLPKGVKKTSNIDYAGTGKARQKLDLYHPEGLEEGEKLPLVCWFHGGGWAVGDKSYVGKILPFITSDEYICASIGFRLSNEVQWPGQLHDCKAAIRFLRANAEKYQIDPERIVVVGSSSGGHIAMMVGLCNDDPKLEGSVGGALDQGSTINCVINFFGPSDLIKISERFKLFNLDSITNPVEKLIGGPLPDYNKQTKAASPLNQVSKDDCPVMIVHGTDDPFVPFEQSVELNKKLKQEGVETQFVTIKRGGHGQNFPYQEVNQSIKAFVDYHLLNLGDKPQDLTLEVTK